MVDVLLSLAATGEGTDALPQAAERADRPGLPQTQTGPVFDPYLKLFAIPPCLVLYLVFTLPLQTHICSCTNWSPF